MPMYSAVTSYRSSVISSSRLPRSACNSAALFFSSRIKPKLRACPVSVCTALIAASRSCRPNASFNSAQQGSVQKSDQEFLQHILVIKATAGCFKISIYRSIKFIQRHIDISLRIFYHFKNRLARGENSFLSSFLDKDRDFAVKRKTPDQMIRRFYGAANQI